MPQDPQPCSKPGCINAAAFRTRTKPAWCDAHITEILRAGGLEPLDPFIGPTAWRLTRCLACRCEAHYRLEYTLDQNSIGIATCRACFWRSWAADSRRMQGAWANTNAVTHEQAQSQAEANGFDYLGPLTDPSLPDDPHRVRCRYCQRISASRLGDVGWGCSCQTNPRRSAQTSRVAGSTKHHLLKDSGLAAVRWWDHEGNDAALLEVLTTRATRNARWRCPDCSLRFSARIIDMTTVPQCPDCEPKWRAKRDAELREERARLAITSVAGVPELLSAWADDADPATVMLGTDSQLRRFKCPAGHHPRLTPLTFLRAGCPSCRGNETRTARLDEVARDPASHQMNREIAAQWHPTRNGQIKLETLSPGSRRRVWWREGSCGHEWEMSPTDREKGQRLRCPTCRTILDSLAYHFPEVAEEWSPLNPLTAWQVRPSGQTTFTPDWVCRRTPNHTWTATLVSRASGSSCPECRETGKSRVEVAHFLVAERLFHQASSGKPIDDPAFQRRARWLVDITTVTAEGLPLAIEYDGAYWHADKHDVDEAKSLDLLAAGFLVVRLREHPLPSLGIVSNRYLELMVHARAPDPERVISEALVWASHADRSQPSRHVRG